MSGSDPADDMAKAERARRLIEEAQASMSNPAMDLANKQAAEFREWQKEMLKVAKENGKKLDEALRQLRTILVRMG